MLTSLAALEADGAVKNTIACSTSGTSCSTGRVQAKKALAHADSIGEWWYIDEKIEDLIYNNVPPLDSLK
jgi:hypothetical protein